MSAVMTTPRVKLSAKDRLALLARTVTDATELTPGYTMADVSANASKPAPADKPTDTPVKPSRLRDGSVRTVDIKNVTYGENSLRAMTTKALRGLALHHKSACGRTEKGNGYSGLKKGQLVEYLLNGCDRVQAQNASGAVPTKKALLAKIEPAGLVKRGASKLSTAQVAQYLDTGTMPARYIRVGTTDYVRGLAATHNVKGRSKMKTDDLIRHLATIGTAVDTMLSDLVNTITPADSHEKKSRAKLIKALSNVTDVHTAMVKLGLE